MNETSLIKDFQLFSIATERSVLGGSLADTTGKAEILLREFEVTPEWFYGNYEQIVAQAVITMIQNRQPVTLHALIEIIKRQHSTTVITSSDLAKYIDDFLTIAYYESDLTILRFLWQKREAMKILAKAPDKIITEEDPLDAVSKIKHELDEVIGTEDRTIRTAEEIKREISMIHKAAKEKGAIGLVSRYNDVQRISAGYPPGLTLIAARPNIGKTTFALNETRFFLQRKPHYRTGWISLDDTEMDLYRTMAAEAAEVNLMRFNLGDYSREEEAAFDHHLDILLQCPLHVSDKKMTIDHIVNWIIFMKQRKALECVFIDYVQVIKPNDFMARWPETQKVTYWSHALHQVGKDTNIPVILLSQINRAGEIPPNAKPEDRWRYVPKLHHLKQAGALEEDARLAIILYNDPTQNRAEEMNVVTLYADIVKNKKGPKGRVPLRYRKDRQRIEKPTEY